MIYRTICWALIVFACFYGLGSYPLLDNNEGMYAAVARDMLSSGHFVIPHLNGVPYIEKPPLLYWLMAASMALFGANEWAARLVPALALFVTAWKMRRFLLRVTGSETASLTAPLILVTSLPLLAIGRMVMFDMLMTCFLSMALIFFYEWWEELRHCEKRSDEAIRCAAKNRIASHSLAMTQYGFYLCLALAVLSKGFVAIILAGGTIAAFLLWQREPWRKWLGVLSPVGILLFLCIAAPWHIAASLEEPGFAWFYFINEHVLRFLNLRQPHDYYTGHWWYYLPRIPAYLMPWTLFLALLFPSPHRGEAGRGAFTVQHQNIEQECPHPNPPPTGEGILRRFLYSWFLFCLAFFSLSGAKANYYMVAGMPPLAMLMALKLEQVLHANPRLIRGLASTALMLIIATVALAKGFCRPGTGDFYPTCQVAAWPVIGLSIACTLVAVALCRRLPPRWIFPLVGANALLLLPLLISGVNAAGDYVSQQPVAEFLQASYGGRAAIYQEFEEFSALAFYLDKPLVIVDSQSSDLLYGQRQLPAGNSSFITLSAWSGQETPPMVVLNKRLGSVTAQLQAMHRQACVIKRFERVSVIGRCH